MRIAVDIGFGFVKVMNENGKKVLFPSVITKRSKNTLRGIVGGSGDDYAVTYWEDGEEEKLFFLGDAGMTNGGTRKWKSKDQFDVEDLKIFITAAVGLVNPDNEPVDLCVGLPFSYYIQKKDELKEGLKNVNSNMKYERIEGVRKTSFNSIFCFPQGAGVYYSTIYDLDGNIKDFAQATKSVGIIDVGYRTTDFLVMGKGRNGISLKESLSGSLEEEGMNKAYQMVESSVSETVGKEIGLVKVEKAILWFDSQLEHKGDDIDITPYEEISYTDLSERISSKIKLKWGEEEDSLNSIIIAGGGGQTLYPVLGKKFEQSELEEDPSFANCRGYLGAQAMQLRKGA